MFKADTFFINIAKLLFLVFSLTAQVSFGLTCSNLLSSNQTMRLSDLQERVLDFYDLSYGLNTLRRALPIGHKNPEVHIESFDDLIMSDDEAPIVVHGVNTYRGQASFNAMSNAFNWGEFSAKPFIDQITSDVEIPSLFISVHAQQTRPHHYITRPFGFSWSRARASFTDSIIDNLLVKEAFSQTPRVLLFDKDFKIPNSRYLSQATVLISSHIGEIDYELPKSRSYHIVGEQFQQCLGDTVKAIVYRDLLDTSDKETTIYVHSDHVLATNGDGINQDSITELFPLENLLDGNVESLIIKHLVPSHISHHIHFNLEQPKFRFEYDDDSRSFTITNLLNNSVVEIVIL